MKPLLLNQSNTQSLPVSREDILILLAAIQLAPLDTSRKTEYLIEKLLELNATDEWKHSILNKDEDRALRYWYLTRGCEHKLDDNNWSQLIKELRSFHFGIDTQNIVRSKVMAFANQTVVITHKHTHSTNKKAKTKGPKKSMTYKEIMELLEKEKIPNESIS